MGSDGTESGVQWKVSGEDIRWQREELTIRAQCEADLPSSLRLGEVEVSCEGWSAPGDRYVLRGAFHQGSARIDRLKRSPATGSCGLDYSLTRMNPGLDGDFPQRGGFDWRESRRSPIGLCH